MFQGECLLCRFLILHPDDHIKGIPFNLVVPHRLVKRSSQREYDLVDGLVLKAPLFLQLVFILLDDNISDVAQQVITKVWDKLCCEMLPVVIYGCFCQPFASPFLFLQDRTLPLDEEVGSIVLELHILLLFLPLKISFCNPLVYYLLCLMLRLPSCGPVVPYVVGVIPVVSPQLSPTA